MTAVLRRHNERIAIVLIGVGFVWFTLVEMLR